MDCYGQELVLDLAGCDVLLFDRPSLRRYFKLLCDGIKMQQAEVFFWDDMGISAKDRQTDPKTKGTSAVQFILTSSVVVHCLDLLAEVYVNIFSCRQFDTSIARTITRNHFGGRIIAEHSFKRGPRVPHKADAADGCRT